MTKATQLDPASSKATSSSSSKATSSSTKAPKASQLAQEVKKCFVPYLHAQQRPLNSYLTVPGLPTMDYLQRNVLYLEPDGAVMTGGPPSFRITTGDPVDVTLNWAREWRELHHMHHQPDAELYRIPLICAANSRRPGGDWETGVSGYEERLCRRSSLSAHLGNVAGGYPLADDAGIYSPGVVVFRTPNNDILPEDQWFDLPIVSVVPVRRPKLTNGGTRYSFAKERSLMQAKARIALRLAAASGCVRVAIAGDFGLGNYYRNPPVELAEMWRELFLRDPEVRGRFEEVAFIFEDEDQTTSKDIQVASDKALEPKSAAVSASRSRLKTSRQPAATEGEGVKFMTDLAVYAYTLQGLELQRARYSVDGLVT